MATAHLCRANAEDCARQARLSIHPNASAAYQELVRAWLVCTPFLVQAPEVLALQTHRIGRSMRSSLMGFAMMGVAALHHQRSTHPTAPSV